MAMNVPAFLCITVLRVSHNSKFGGNRKISTRRFPLRQKSTVADNRRRVNERREMKPISGEKSQERDARSISRAALQTFLVD
jgi:hypothetical protein